jgi:hypothetical protein
VKESGGTQDKPESLAELAEQVASTYADYSFSEWEERESLGPSAEGLLVDEKRSPHGHHLRMLRRKVQTKALDERGKLTCLGNGWPQQ